VGEREVVFTTGRNINLTFYLMMLLRTFPENIGFLINGLYIIRAKALFTYLNIGLYPSGYK